MSKRRKIQTVSNESEIITPEFFYKITTTPCIIAVDGSLVVKAKIESNLVTPYFIDCN